MMNLGEAIKIVRTRKGITAMSLAKQVGISQSAMSKFENGTRQLSDETIDKLINALHTTRVSILSEANDERIPDNNIKKRTRKNVNILVGNNVRTARIRSGLTQSDVAEIIHTSAPNIVRYETGVSSLSPETIISLCAALKVSADELLGIKIDGVENNITLSEPELRLINNLRALDKYGQKAVTSVCEIELERLSDVEQRKPPHVITSKTAGTRYIRKYEFASAAGFNVPGSDAGFDMIPVTDSTPYEADFAVPISGTSMEPYIHDGDTVYVQSAKSMPGELRNGEIGIFSVDGALYCKQYFRDELGNVYLLSANPDMRESNISLSASGGSSLTVYGKVLLKEKPKLPDYFLSELCV